MNSGMERDFDENISLRLWHQLLKKLNNVGTFLRHLAHLLAVFETDTCAENRIALGDEISVVDAVHVIEQIAIGDARQLSQDHITIAIITGTICFIF